MTWGVEALEVRYGDRPAVSGVTLEVPAGSVTAVVGGDGSGKTTVLRALVGTVRPAAGRVRRPPPRRTGYMSAGGGLYRDLTADENLAFAGSAYGVGGEELARRADRLVEGTRLAEARARLAGQLSGGMRHKLALAMALLPEPELLVLDEPTTGIDPVSRSELWRLIAAAAAGGAALLMSTTYLDEAERAARVLVLDEGRPLVDGTPEEVIASVPGAVLEAESRPDDRHAWRRGGRWRVWSPEGEVLPGTSPAVVGLEDAVTVAALARLAREEAP